MSTGSLGSSTFTIGANVNPFLGGMKQAQAAAVRTHQVVAGQTAATAAAVTTNLNAAGRAVQNLNAQMGGIGKSGRGAGLGLLQLGYAVDDLQYGFRAIVNNIPQMVYMMGGSAGLAGGAAIAAVAVNQLVSHWDQLMDSMKAGWLNVPAADLERLRVRAEKAGEAFDKLMLMPSKVRAAQIKALEEAFTEADKGGPAMALKMFGEAMRQEPAGSKLRASLEPWEEMQRNSLEHEKAIMRKTAGPGVDVTTTDRWKKVQEALAALTKVLDKRQGEIVRQQIGLAASGEAGGNEALTTLINLIKRYPKTFEGFPKFVKAMAETTEEAVANKAANQSAAKHLMAGPALTDLLLGGGGGEKAGGPLSAKQVSALMRRHPVLGRLTAKAREAFAGKMAGMTEEQANQAMGGITPKSIEEIGKNFPLSKGGHEIATMLPGLIKAAKEAPPGKPKPNAFEEGIGRALKGAGVEGDAKGTVKEMREMLRERVRAVMLERGVTEQQAKQILLRERAQGLMKQIGPAQILGTDERSRQILGGGSGMAAMPDLTKKSLDELVKIREALTAMQQKAGGAAPAVAAGPR